MAPTPFFSLIDRTMSQRDPSEALALIEQHRTHAKHTLLEALGIEIIELNPDRVVGTMPVDARTRQPFGVLHGGASVALAETIVSVGAWANVDRDRYQAFGLEINANHLRPKTEGIVTGVATPIHRGRTTQVWSAEIRDEADRLVCVARCTMAIVPSQR